MFTQILRVMLSKAKHPALGLCKRQGEILPIVRMTNEAESESRVKLT